MVVAYLAQNNYSNQCWLTVKRDLWNKYYWNQSTRNKCSFHEYHLKLTCARCRPLRHWLVYYNIKINRIDIILFMIYMHRNNTQWRSQNMFQMFLNVENNNTKSVIIFFGKSVQLQIFLTNTYVCTMYFVFPHNIHAVSATCNQIHLKISPVVELKT